MLPEASGGQWELSEGAWRVFSFDLLHLLRLGWNGFCKALAFAFACFLFRMWSARAEGHGSKPANRPEMPKRAMPFSACVCEELVCQKPEHCQVHMGAA